MKGVILAGGNGTRLRPTTRVINKHLIPVYDKPMILYPIGTLKELGITDIIMIVGGDHLGSFMEFLQDGREFGINLTYRIQAESKGIAHALYLAKEFVGKDNFAVILGDNIFESASLPTTNCGLVTKEVESPNRFGVYHEGKIVEKPENPKSKQAVTGLYFYPPEIFPFIETMKPSARGEMEITDVNNWCLENFEVDVIPYEGFWSDAGTVDSLFTSSEWAKKKYGLPK